MNKIYSMVMLMLAWFGASTANAQVETLADLFGTYNFTATVEIVDQAYADKFKKECEVKIVKGDAYIDAYLCGLAGVENGEQPIYKLTSEKNGIILRNVNGGNYDAWGSLGAYMTTLEGDNPYLAKYSDIVFSFDPATLSFTLPDFSFVKISDWNAEKGQIVAKFTNVKMTLKAKEEIIINDISGNYHFTASQIYDYGKMEWSNEFDMTLTAKDASNKAYNVEWNLEKYGKFTFEGKYDGAKLSIPFDKVCIDKENGIYMAPTYGTAVDGTVEFNTVGDNLSLSSGFSVAKAFFTGETLDSLDYIFWYGGGIAKNQKQPEVTFTYAGKYNATATVEYPTENITTPVSGPIEIVYDELWDMYLVTNFLGYDTYSLNQGGIEFKPDTDDPMKGTLNLSFNYLEFLNMTEAGDYKYLMLFDGNLDNSTIKVTFAEDGTMTLGEFCIGTGTYTGTEPNVLISWYSGLTATKSVPSAKDWIGDHTVTPITYATVAEGANVPTTGAFNVTYYEDTNEYLVEYFLGYDLYSMNYGGLLLTPDANDPHKAILECGIADFDSETMEAISLFDKDLKESGIEVTLNDDGTVSVGDFIIAKGPWNGAPTSVIASTVAETAISSLSIDKAEGKMFNLSGVQVKGLQRGVVIKNIGGKMVKVIK